MVLSWGKPKIEICKLVDGKLPITPNWIELDTPVENSSKMTATKGDKKEMKIEGGEVIATRYGKNSYLFECEIPVGAGSEKPIKDEDGVIHDEYAVRLTPENDDAQGWIMEKTNVSCEDTWDSESGSKWKYSFDGVKPNSGAICKPYKAV